MQTHDIHYLGFAIVQRIPKNEYAVAVAIGCEKVMTKVRMTFPNQYLLYVLAPNGGAKQQTPLNSNSRSSLTRLECVFTHS